MEVIRKKYKLFFVVSMIILLSFLNVIAASGAQNLIGSYYVGKTYTGSYLRIGINNYGALGIYDSDLGEDVGFQYPIGYDYESLAVGWCGDGWSVFYGDSSAGFSPDDDAWGTIEGATPTVTWIATPYGYLHIIKISTNDNTLLLEFRMEIFNNKKYIKIETYITNIGTETITDLEYKRIVDWDVWCPLIGGYYNYWGMDDIRRPNLNLAVAFVNTTIASSTVYMGFASLEPPTDYDLNWDDYMSRGLAGPVKFSIGSDGVAPYLGDYCVVYDWFLGTLRPGETKAIHMVYAAGDTLGELENNVEEALSQYRLPVGGVVLPTEVSALTTLHLLNMVLITVTVVIMATSLLIFMKKRLKILC